jgi:hypothetical protein
LKKAEGARDLGRSFKMKKPSGKIQMVFGRRGDRTPDNLGVNQVLSQLSYSPFDFLILAISKKKVK